MLKALQKIFGTKTERELKEAKAEITHLNSLLLAIRNINQLIVSEKNCDKLIKEACNSLTETRDFNHAWIALYDEKGNYLTASESGLKNDFKGLVKTLKAGKKPQCITHEAKKASGARKATYHFTSEATGATRAATPAIK